MIRIHSGLRTLWFAHAQVSMDAFGERGYDLDMGILDLNHQFSPWKRIACAKIKGSYSSSTIALGFLISQCGFSVILVGTCGFGV